MNDPVPMSTRTIWIAAAVVFGLAFLVSIFKGSFIFAILLLLIVAGCVYQSRRAPANDADVEERKAQAEEDDGDDRHDGDGDDDDDEREDDREREDDAHEDDDEPRAEARRDDAD